MPSIVDFEKLDEDIRSEENAPLPRFMQKAPTDYPPAGPEAYAPKMPRAVVPAQPAQPAPAPLPFEHSKDISDKLTKTGDLASEAIAREFIATSNFIKQQGNEYAVMLRKVAEMLRSVAGEIDAEANDVLEQMRGVALDYETKGRAIFDIVGHASTLSTRAMDTLAELARHLKTDD